MIKGKTKSGIEFQLNEEVKNDARFIYYLAKIQDKDLPVEEMSINIMSMLELIFGSGDGVIEFMNTVAAHNNGVCNVKVLLAEITEMFNALNVKN